MTAASPSRDGASRHSYSEFVNRALMERHQAPLFYASTVLVSLSAGMLVARNQQGTSMLLLGLLALAWTAVLVSLPAHALVLGWLFLAPLFQSSADGTAAGRALTWALYIAPALIMLGLTLLRRERVLEARVIDYLPGAYVAYVIASLALTSDMLQTSPMGSLKAIFTILAIGPVVYYFLTFGPGVQVSSERIVGAITNSVPARSSRPASARHSSIARTRPKCGTGTSSPSTGFDARERAASGARWATIWWPWKSKSIQRFELRPSAQPRRPP